MLLDILLSSIRYLMMGVFLLGMVVLLLIIFGGALEIIGYSIWS
jgi:hypothetical protein